jgi:hypothetical protein
MLVEGTIYLLRWMWGLWGHQRQLGTRICSIKFVTCFNKCLPLSVCFTLKIAAYKNNPFCMPYVGYERFFRIFLMKKLMKRISIFYTLDNHIRCLYRSQYCAVCCVLGWLITCCRSVLIRNRSCLKAGKV